MTKQTCLLSRIAVEFHVGWSGWTRPPTMGAAGGAPRERGTRGCFSEGSEAG